MHENVSSETTCSTQTNVVSDKMGRRINCASISKIWLTIRAKSRRFSAGE